MCRHVRTILFVVCTALAWTNPAAADVVTDWNQTILATAGAAAPAGRGATPASLIDIATVHLAMHDAAQAYDKRFESYAGVIPGASGSSIVAVAKAAHDVLANRFPLQAGALGTLYSTYLSNLVPLPSAEAIANGEAIGRQAALNVIGARLGDGSFPSSFAQFTGGTGPGQWRPNAGTPGMVAPWAGDVRPFAIETVQRCEPDELPALTSLEYAEAYFEVKAFGRATNSARTAEQGEIARMYSGAFPAQYNRLLRDIALAHLAGSDVASLGDRARLFALTTAASADAFICSWHAKKKFNFWRPTTAIQEGHLDGNILTDRDATWTAYFGVPPNYSDYTSGANNLTGATFRMLQLYFGNDRPFSFNIWSINPAVPLLASDPNPRVYTRFSDVMKDVIDARVWLGIHFRFADTEARSQGRRAAMHTFKNILTPFDKKDK
jgi:hypothetical protein